MARTYATQHGRATPTHLSVDSGFKDATALYMNLLPSIGEFTALSELINVYLRGAPRKLNSRSTCYVLYACCYYIPPVLYVIENNTQQSTS